MMNLASRTLLATGVAACLAQSAPAEHSLAEPASAIVVLSQAIEPLPEESETPAAAPPVAQGTLPGALARQPGRPFPAARGLFRLPAQRLGDAADDAAPTEDDPRMPRLLPTSLAEFFQPRADDAAPPLSPIEPTTHAIPPLPSDHPSAGDFAVEPVQQPPQPPVHIPKEGCCEVQPASSVPLPAVRFPHFSRLFRRS